MTRQVLATFASATLLLGAVGCTAKYSTVKTGSMPSASIQRLDANSTIYVAVPKDGAYSDKTYGGSGRMVATSVAQAFARKAKAVETAEGEQTRDQVLNAAKRMGAQYAVIPVITHWEQRATEWSGRPSRMAIDVSVYDTESNGRIDSRAITARSRIVSFTSTSPESLLSSPLKQYIEELYGTASRE